MVVKKVSKAKTSKKSIKKNSVKKSSENKVSLKKKKSQIKQEFNEFADGVAKLEAYRREINSLDTRGFGVEAKSIRSKLKDINQLPKITREMNELEKKIKLRDARKRVKSNNTKKLLSKSKDIEEDQKIMKNKINNLNTKIKSHTEKLKPGTLLTKKDKKSIEVIPDLKKELRELRKDFHDHTNVSEVRIDTGIGLIVDDKFDDFIQEIKAKLTERVKEKEGEMDQELNVDMKQHEELFARRYQEIVNKFHKMYKQKVHDELGKEVRKKFNDRLQLKIDKLRKDIERELLREDSKRLNKEHNELVHNLTEEYHKKEDKLRANTKKELEDKKKGLRKEFEMNINQLKKKMQRELSSQWLKLKKIEQKSMNEQMSKREKDMRKQLDREYEFRLKQELKIRAAEIDKRKAELEKHVVSEARKLFKI